MLPGGLSPHPRLPVREILSSECLHVVMQRPGQLRDSGSSHLLPLMPLCQESELRDPPFRQRVKDG